jgi:hypothetical protein
MMPAANESKGGKFSGLWLPVGVVGVYFALQLWILPAAGVPT